MKKISPKLIYIISVLIILTLLLILIGYTIFFTIFLILSIFIYTLLFTDLYKTRITNTLYVWIFLVAFALLNTTTIILLKNNSKTSTEQLTKEQCAPIYEAYNDTVLDISSDGLKGTVGIKINEEDCRATVTYNFLFNTQLPKNFQLNQYSNPEYQYTAVLRSPDQTREDGDYGMIFYVLKNKDTLPDPFTMAFDEVDYGRDDATGTTSTFVQAWNSSYIFKDDRYEKILSKTVYEIVDGESSMDIEQMDSGATSYSLDSELAAKQGDVVKTFTLTYTER